MVDIHSHILPGLDDGAQTLEESVAMAAHRGGKRNDGYRRNAACQRRIYV
jgi:Capsular polysaccharide biosynthesis protein